MIITHPRLRVVEPYSGYCSSGCLMTIINYFYIAGFGKKDSTDLIALVKKGNYQLGDSVGESEMCLFLLNLGFKITWYSTDVGGLEEYIKNPEEYCRKRNILPYSRVDLQADAKATAAILEHPLFLAIEDSNLDVYEIVKSMQSTNRIFLWGGEWFLIQGKNRPYGEKEHSGHYILCTQADNDSFIIQDPGPPARDNVSIKKEQMYKAATYYGGKLGIIMIEKNEE